MSKCALSLVAAAGPGLAIGAFVRQPTPPRSAIERPMLQKLASPAP